MVDWKFNVELLQENFAISFFLFNHFKFTTPDKYEPVKGYIAFDYLLLLKKYNKNT